MEYEKKKIPWKDWLPSVIGGVLGLVLVFLEKKEVFTFQQLFFVVVVGVISLVLSVVFHELGHLVAGLWSGYRFLSFRLGSVVFQVSGEPPEVEPEITVNQEETADSTTNSPENSQENPPVEDNPSEETIEARRAMREEIQGFTPEEVEESPESEEEDSTQELGAHFYVEKAEFDPTQGLDLEKYDYLYEKARKEAQEEEEALAKAKAEAEAQEAEEDYFYEEPEITRWFQVKKYKVPGTLGQCLLVPAPFRNPHYVPYQAYLLGGGLANLLSIPLMSLLLLINRDLWWIVATFAVVALFLALQNLIPMKIGGLPNDGYVIRLCNDDPHSHAAFVYQMRIVGALADGISVGDMPEEWFYAKFPLQERMTSNPIIANLWLETANRFFVHGEIFQAKIIFEALYNAQGLMPMLRQNGLYGFLFAMITEGRIEHAQTYPIGKDLAKRAKKLEKFYPFYCAYSFAYGKLVRQSGKLMKESKLRFEKTSKKYPYDGEVADLRVMMDRLDDVIIQR